MEEEKKVRRALEEAAQVQKEEMGRLRTELDAKGKELEEQGIELEARAGRLVQYELLEKEFRAQQALWENSLTSYQNSLEEENKVRRVLEEAAQVQKEEMGRLRTELEAKGKELEEQGRELEARGVRLAQCELLEKDLRGQIEAKNRELGDRWREVEGKNWELGERWREIEGKNRELGDRTREIESKNQELGNQWRELEARAVRLMQYENSEKDLRARQESLEGAIKAREEEIVQLKTQCENGEKEFWSQQTAWEEKFDVQQASLNEGQATIKIWKEEVEVLNESLIRMTKSRDTLQKQINDFYASRSFRYLIGPFWRTLNLMKHWQQSILSIGKRPPKVKDCREQVLFIKPQRVSVNEAKWKIHEFKVQNPNVRVAALANLTQEDYEKMFPDSDLLFDEKFFYSPQIKKFNWIEKIKFLFKIRQRKLRKAIILVCAPAYRGYKLALILAMLTGAKKVEIQRVQEGTDVRGVCITKEFLGIETFKDMLLLPFRVLLIVAVVLWFVVFIAGGIQCRKFFYQFRRAGR